MRSIYQCGEHVACIWTDDVGNNINWHLGVVDRYDHDTGCQRYPMAVPRRGRNPSHT